MSSVKLSRCPYCGRKISYIGSMFLKSKGEFNCDRCKCVSNVVINRALYGIASGVCVLAFLIVVLYTQFGDHGSLLGILWVLLPFLAFYILIPFFVTLEPCNEKSAVKIVIESSSPKRNQTVQQTVQPSSAVQPKAKPIELDVDDDFSTKFMQAKVNFTQKISESEKSLSDAPDSSEQDIQNTQILFELNEENNTEKKGD